VHTQLAFYKQSTKRRYRLEDRPSRCLVQLSYRRRAAEVGEIIVMEAVKGMPDRHAFFNFPPSSSLQSNSDEGI
jgi:hypothetical protein